MHTSTQARLSSVANVTNVVPSLYKYMYNIFTKDPLPAKSTILLNFDMRQY